MLIQTIFFNIEEEKIMAIRQIAKIGEPVLRKKAKVVTKFDEKLVELLEDMADTMYEADGVGLAAPQVSILKRVVVIDVGEGLLELVNPFSCPHGRPTVIKLSKYEIERKFARK